MPTHAFTIGKLAVAAGVGIETVRYYQRRGILAEPKRANGGFRAYDHSHVECLQFIRRALDLGFSLDDAAELVTLSRLANRKKLRAVARARAAEIRQRMTKLSAVAHALEHLADCCEHTPAGEACPIVAALTDDATDDCVA